MFALLADASSACSLFADAPSTFTLGLIGGGCLLAYEYFRRKPSPIVAETLALVQRATEDVCDVAETEHRLAA